MPGAVSRLLLTALLCGVAMGGAPGSARGAAGVVFNEHMIEELGRELDLEDPMAVFRAVFAALEDEVFVYPTENYYYFKLHANGRTVAGNLRLDALDRDDGVIHIGYFEFDETGTYQDRQGKGGAIAAADGVEVARLEPFLYAVTAFGRTVRFRLNDSGREAPPQGMLRPEETYVGRVQDESGLAFFLVFQEPNAHFMYLLDDTGAKVPEHFLAGPPEVLIGRRTGFAFFDDRALGRKVLIAVHGRNTDRNNYYDGPFDQLPDNHVEETGIGALIERAYPRMRGHIDAYGHFKNDPTGRVAITPYYVYYDQAELEFVASCRSSSDDPVMLYPCITPDFQKMMMTGQPAPAAEPSVEPRVLTDGVIGGSVR